MKENEFMQTFLEQHRKATILDVVESFIKSSDSNYIERDTLCRLIGVDSLCAELTYVTEKAQKNAETIDLILDFVKPLLHSDEFRDLMLVAGLVDEEVKEYGNRAEDSVESD